MYDDLAEPEDTMRGRQWLGIGLIPATIIVGVVWWGGQGRAAENDFAVEATAMPQPVPTEMPQAPPAEIQGARAIQPTILGAAPGVPTFNVQDVLTYVAAHPASGGKISALETPTVGSVEFLASRDVATRIDHGTGLPDDRLLCLVTLHGTFAVPAPPGAKARPTALTQYLVFDARTGNLLSASLGR